MDLKDTLKTLMELGVSTGEVRTVGNIPFVVAPKDWDVKSLENHVFNAHREHPERKVATVQVRTPESFVEYWKLFSDQDSQAFASDVDCRVIGILDYHHAGSEMAARWTKHQVHLQLEKTDEWKTWLKNDGKQMDQTSFAEFLEDNAPDIINPVAATFVECARELRAKSDMDFKSKFNPVSGAVEFGYTETVQGKMGSGTIEIPENFTIAVPVFLGMRKVQIGARFRFRVNGGKLTLWYQLYRPGYEERSAFEAATASISEQIGKHVFLGKP